MPTALTLQLPKKKCDGLKVCEPTWRLRVWVWQLQIDPQVPKRQISRLRACLLAVPLIDDGGAARNPDPTRNKLRKTCVQHVRHIFEVCTVHIGVKGVSWHDVLW
jgi:hypothetical protein